MFNDAGGIAFTGWLTGIGVDSSNDNGIWAGESDRLALIARSGDQPPGISLQASFLRFEGPVLNDPGQVAFRARLTSNDVDNPLNFGIFSNSSGALGLIARSGQTPPGFVEGEVFDYFGDSSLNNLGQTAILGLHPGRLCDRQRQDTIWSESSGSLALVARQGDPAQGTLDRYTFCRI